MFLLRIADNDARQLFPVTAYNSHKSRQGFPLQKLLIKCQYRIAFAYPDTFFMT
jgi:hypothetical protein